jgi:hypothetical protein
MAWTVTPKMSWTQKFHCHERSEDVSVSQLERTRQKLTALDGTSDDAANAGTNGRTQYDKAQPPMLIFRLIKVRNQAQGHTAASGRQAALYIVSAELIKTNSKTYQSSANNDSPEIWSNRTRNLPDVDQKHAQLQNRPATKFLAPRCPQLASERVEDEIDHLTNSCRLVTDPKVLRQGFHGAWVHGGVKVH